MAEDTVAAVSAIFAEAGWRPMPAPPRAGLFCAESSGGYWLGGIAPNGAVHSSHTHMTDPPQDAETIARNLVAAEGRKYRFKRKATETVLPPPRIVLDEPGELAEDSGDENAEPVAEPVVDARCPRGAGDPDTEFDGTNDEDAERRRDYHPIDADFSEPAPELGQELAEEHPEEFGGAGDAGGKFYFSDNLDQMRREVAGVIGIIAEQKSAEVEAAANEQPDEYVTLQGFVTTNLDKFTGMFSLQDEESRAKYRRWVDLDSAHKTVILIDRRRRDLTKMILAATREEIEAFDPEAGWP